MLLNKFMNLPVMERRLFLEAWGWLAIARMMILILPFRQIAPWLGRTMAESSHDFCRQHALAWKISWAVQTASRYTPWKSKCLAQAIAGKMMLRRRNLSSTLYLGLAKDEQGELTAHAWLRCGELILTGGQHHEDFTAIAFFTEG
jgi:hypothetical protein